MKRLIVTTTGTIAGLAALLSFKTQTHSTATGALPAASLGAQSTTSSSASSSPGSSGTTSAGGSGATSSSSSPSSSSASKTAAAQTSKTYLGSPITTRYGVVQVKVTVKGKTITNVTFAQLQAFDGRSAQINSYAGPQLLEETIKAQSAQVDTVSGASYTSDGYRQSLQSALDKAGI